MKLFDNTAKMAVTAATAFLIPLSKAGGASILNLADQDWMLTSPGNDSIKVTGKVPSHAHVDLYNAGVIDDP